MRTCDQEYERSSFRVGNLLHCDTVSAIEGEPSDSLSNNNTEAIRLMSFSFPCASGLKGRTKYGSLDDRASGQVYDHILPSKSCSDGKDSYHSHCEKEDEVLVDRLRSYSLSGKYGAGRNSVGSMVSPRSPFSCDNKVQSFSRCSTADSNRKSSVFSSSSNTSRSSVGSPRSGHTKSLHRRSSAMLNEQELPLFYNKPNWGLGKGGQMCAGGLSQRRYLDSCNINRSPLACDSSCTEFAYLSRPGKDLGLQGRRNSIGYLGGKKCGSDIGDIPSGDCSDFADYYEVDGVKYPAINIDAENITPERRRKGDLFVPINSFAHCPSLNSRKRVCNVDVLTSQIEEDQESCCVCSGDELDSSYFGDDTQDGLLSFHEFLRDC